MEVQESRLWRFYASRGWGETADLARSTASRKHLYNWKAKYGGMDVSEAKRLRLLEDGTAS